MLFFIRREDIYLRKEWTFSKLSTLNFSKPDLDVFEGLKMAISAGKKGGSSPTVLNAANEWAVDKILK